MFTSKMCKHNTSIGIIQERMSYRCYGFQALYAQEYVSHYFSTQQMAKFMFFAEREKKNMKME